MLHLGSTKTNTIAYFRPDLGNPLPFYVDFAENDCKIGNVEQFFRFSTAIYVCPVFIMEANNIICFSKDTVR